MESNQIFTEQVLKNEILYVSVLNKLNIELNNIEVYSNGQILSCDIELTESNKQILNEIITNFDLYQESYQEFTGNQPKENHIDLCVLVDFVENTFQEEIFFDWDSEEFYINGFD